jgi:Leucine-rich repeat
MLFDRYEGDRLLLKMWRPACRCCLSILRAALAQTHRFYAGNNHLSRLEKISYLRQFQHLELVNLADNPICREANYWSYILSHLKHLKYLDYNRVQADDVAQAIEHHQDEVLDLREKDEAHEEELKALAVVTQQALLMSEANLQGVDSLFDDLTKDDADWHKLAQVQSRVVKPSRSFSQICCAEGSPARIPNYIT